MAILPSMIHNDICDGCGDIQPQLLRRPDGSFLCRTCTMRRLILPAVTDDVCDRCGDFERQLFYAHDTMYMCSTCIFGLFQESGHQHMRSAKQQPNTNQEKAA